MIRHLSDSLTLAGLALVAGSLVALFGVAVAALVLGVALVLGGIASDGRGS